MSDDPSKLRLRFHHNVIEHLGLRLYDNKSDKVICELVSNSWDADATKVVINLSGDDKQLTVLDNGIGMDRAVLQRSYLTIAAPRRSGQNAQAASPGGRPLMGRKGIGKLAPFGICSTVDVLTGSEAAGFEWITLDLGAIQDASPSADSDNPGDYSPTEHVRNGTLQDVLAVERLPAARDQFVQCINEAPAKSGTCVVLTALNERARISAADFRKALGARFTVTLAKPDFVVTVDGAPIVADEVLPKFVFRVPESGFITDQVGSNEVRYWVGFTEKPVSKTNEYGIGVFAHGKIAQERPFWFEASGNDLYLPYMYGVVEADWIDDFAEDIISTDRTSIDWTHPQASLLHEWGRLSVRQWISRFETYRRDADTAATSDTIERGVAAGTIPNLTSAERRSLVELLSDLTPQLPPNDEIRSATVSALADAWLHKPAREMISKLWKSIRANAGGGESFVSTVETLREYLVPEALSVSVTFAQRAFALTILHEITNLGKEPDLQRLIETFPWIAGPEFEYLTANNTLNTVVSEAKSRGMFPRDSDHIVSGEIKPDFVFLSNSTEKEIIVVELKSPQVELTIENREQLYSYMTFLETKFPDSKIRGLLLGNAPGGFSNPRNDVLVRSWPDVFLLARSSYTGMLASMLNGYADSPRDARISEIHDFGGEKVWDLLQSIAERDENLKSLLGERARGPGSERGDSLDLQLLLSRDTGLVSRSSSTAGVARLPSPGKKT